MDNEHNLDDKTYVILSVVILIFVIVLVIYLQSVKCEQKTRDIGFESHWSFLGGCRILKDGYWIPLDNYRSI